MGIKRRIGTLTKSSPKILSTEFLLQNHADIVGTIIVIITTSLIFEPTSKYAFRFVALQHNSTDRKYFSPETRLINLMLNSITNHLLLISVIAVISAEANLPMLYTYGINDIFCVIFYCLVCIVAHGVVQQYLLDRSARKLHLSKIKHSKFNESGQLLTFYVLSLAWAMELLRRDNANRHSIRETIAGPQSDMSYGIKLFYITQIAYWLHCFPELYLQKVRKEELTPRMVYMTLYLISFIGAYFANVTRLALVLIILHYLVEATFHTARLLYFRLNNDLYPLLFKIWNCVFVAARLVSITLSLLVLGLGMEPKGSEPILGNTRYAVLAVVIALQIHLMWKYLVFHTARMRPLEPPTVPISKKK